MKKYILCVLLGGCFLLSAYGIEISGGPYAGIGFDHSLFDKEVKDSGLLSLLNTKEKLKFSTTGGFLLDFKFSDYFTLETDVNISNARAVLEGDYQFSDEVNLLNLGIHLLLKPQYPLVRDSEGNPFFSLYALVGGGLGIILTGGETVIFSGASSSLLPGLSTLALDVKATPFPAGVFGLGGEIKLGRGILSLDLRYFLNDTQKVDLFLNREFLNQFRVAVGYRFIF